MCVACIVKFGQVSTGDSSGCQSFYTLFDRHKTTPHPRVDIGALQTRAFDVLLTRKWPSG